MNDLLKKNITIVEAVNDGTKVKIKDQDGLSYTFFIKKQDGTESMAYQFFKTLEANGKGVSASIGYKETQGEFKGQSVTYRNIAVMGYGNAQSVSKTVAQVKYHEVKKDDEQEKWDKIALGKVRHGFAIEAFKLGLELNAETVKIVNSWSEYVMTGELEVKPSPADYMLSAKKEAMDIPVIQQDEWIPEQLSDDVDLNALFPGK